MPPDRQNGKPFTPTLSSNFRSTKSPLTPRLAGGARKSPATTKREPFVRQPSPNKEEASPLTLNITPRTAARRSRIGTESPSTTPTTSRTGTAPRAAATTSADISTPSSQGPGIQSPLAAASTPLNALQNLTQSPTPVYTVPRRVSNARSAVTADGTNDGKFFRADTAKVHHLQTHDRATTEPDPHFFYVGGHTDNSMVSPRLSPSKSVHSPTGSGVEEKFFHASNARPNYQRSIARSEIHTQSKPGSVVAGPSPQPGNRNVLAATRSRSPVKGPQVGRPLSRGKDGQSHIHAVVASLSDRRRGSMGSSASEAKDAQMNHRKSMSANSVAATPTRKLSGPRPLALPTLEQRLGMSTASADALLIPKASPEPLSPRSVSLGSGPSEIGPLGDPVVDVPISTNEVDQLTSPSLAPTNRPNDPAAQARRERKVLDLEISNSSLLAINKTLERELRKQNVELRRFRRLSRSGRLSFAPSGRNVSNSTLGTLPEIGDESEYSQSDSEAGGDDYEDDEFDITESSSGMTSPTARTQQRARDERRLILDLNKHRQMLVDSQKLSQSIKRCLTCTEELIRDGTKALDYKVGIGDVHIGGRVLGNDESDNHDDTSRDEGRKGLLSPGIEIGNWLEGGLWVSQRPSIADGASPEWSITSPGVIQEPDLTFAIVESPSPLYETAFS